MMIAERVKVNAPVAIHNAKGIEVARGHIAQRTGMLLCEEDDVSHDGLRPLIHKSGQVRIHTALGSVFAKLSELSEVGL